MTLQKKHLVYFIWWTYGSKRGGDVTVVASAAEPRTSAYTHNTVDRHISLCSLSAADDDITSKEPRRTSNWEGRGPRASLRPHHPTQLDGHRMSSRPYPGRAVCAGCNIL